MIRAVLLSAVLCACGGGSAKPPAAEPIANTQPAAPPPPAPPPPAAPQARIERTLATMERFTADMCACTDEQCVQGVTHAVIAWSQKEAADAKERAKFTEDQQNRARTTGNHMAACMQNAMGSASSGTSHGKP